MKKLKYLTIFFAGVFTDDNGKQPTIDSRLEGATHLENILFTPSAVQRTLQNLKPTSSAGPDQIPNLLLKSLAFELSHPLCHIFDMSFKCQQLPQVWKHAFVTPVFKNGTTCEANNYRPISLTSTCCRVMERIINKQLLDYLSIV